jgi:hypothetical protein
MSSPNAKTFSQSKRHPVSGEFRAQYARARERVRSESESPSCRSGWIIPPRGQTTPNFVSP